MDPLAINGGVPIRTKSLPYGHQWIDDEDILSVVETLKSDWITQGPRVEEFERRVAQYCGAKYAVAVANGTAALHAACRVAGISDGDEVIVPPITFAATANAVVYCGGKPVFADIRADTLNIDVKEVKRKLSTKTKVVLPVDFTGLPCDLDEITSLAKKRGLVVIEDACHALGAEYKARRIGVQSDMTVFSFHPVKHITTGEGGMILTDKQEYFEKLRVFRHHGIVKDQVDEEGAWHYSIHEPGYNLRITDFQCALGISQLKKLDWFVQRRREIAARYDKVFSTVNEIVTPLKIKDTKSAYHIYVIQLRLEELKADRRKVFDSLRAENIEVNVHYVPLHLQPFYRRRFGYEPGDFPKAENYYARAITLPVFPQMSDGDVQDVIDAVTKVIYYYRK